MSPDDGLKNGVKREKRSEAKELSALRIPKLALSNDGELSHRSDRQRLIHDFLKAYPRRFSDAYPEMHLIPIALAFTNVIAPKAPFDDVIQLRIELVKRAFKAIDAGAAVQEVARCVLAEEIFPIEARSLVQDFLHQITKELDNPLVDASTKVSTSLNARGGQLQEVFLALDLAGDRIRSDVASSSMSSVAGDEAIKRECERLSHIRFTPEVRGLKGGVVRGLIGALRGNYHALERHFLGIESDPYRVGMLVFKDVIWVASALMVTGASTDTVVAAILLHADNAVDSDKRGWLSENAKKFSAGVQTLLSHVKSAQPDPLQAPDRISILNCQRPLVIVSGATESVMKGARAIATASALSPALGAPVFPMLDQVLPLQVGESSNYFLVEARARCQDAVLGDPTLWFDPERLPKGDSDFDHPLVMIGVRDLFNSYRAKGKSAYLPLHLLTRLIIEITSERGGERLFREAYTHPVFLPKSEGISTDRSIDELSSTEADRIIAGLSQELCSRVTVTERRCRTLLGSFNSVRFDVLTESERYQEYMARLRFESAPTIDSYAMTGKYIFHVMSKVRQRIGWFLHRRSSDHCPEVTEGLQELRHLVAQGYLFDTSEALDKHLKSPPDIFLPHWGEHTWLSRLGLPEVLSGLSRGLLAAQGSGLILAGGEDETVQRLFNIAVEEWSYHLTRWDSTRNHLVFGLARGLTSVQLMGEDAARAIYTADERRQFESASEFLMEFIRDLRLTGTPRDLEDTYRHSLEVGMILALSGAPADVVIAGFLHDMYELAARADTANSELTVEPKPKSKLPEVKGIVRERFGTSVDQLIEIVSERRGSRNLAFVERKMEIFERVKRYHVFDKVVSRKAITVLLAGKISTLADGLTLVRERGSLKGWSEGDYLDNLHVMLATRDLAERMFERNILTGIFDELVTNWCKAADTRVSQVSLAQSYYLSGSPPGSGPIVQGELEKADSLLFSAAAAGHPSALRQSAELFMTGERGRPKSSVQAIKLLNEAIHRGRYMNRREHFLLWDLGALERCYESGLFEGESVGDTAEVVRSLRSAAEVGDLGAEYQLGLCHYHGWGVSKDLVIARNHFVKGLAMLQAAGWGHRETGDGLVFPGDPLRNFFNSFEEELFCRLSTKLGDIYEHGGSGIRPNLALSMRYYRNIVKVPLRYHREEYAVIYMTVRKLVASEHIYDPRVRELDRFVDYYLKQLGHIEVMRKGESAYDEQKLVKSLSKRAARFARAIRRLQSDSEANPLPSFFRYSPQEILDWLRTG